MLGGVVLGCDLELFDGLLALFMEIVQAALDAGDSVVEDSGAKRAHTVDTGGTRTACQQCGNVQIKDRRTGPARLRWLHIP